MNHATVASLDTLSPPTAAGGLALRWADAAARLYWLEPEAERILAWREGAEVARQKMRSPLSTLAACASGNLLVGMEKRLCIVAPEARPAAAKRDALADRILATVDAVDPRTILGDGRTDREGHFVFGTRNIGEDRRPIGSFYQYSCRHGLRRLALPTVTWAAGICFSRDGRRMYFGDAAAGLLYRCRYDAQAAAIADVQPFASAAGLALMRDAIVDGEDCVWTAQGAQGEDAVVRHGPDGTELGRFALAPGRARSLAFGGAALDRLFMVGADGALSALAGYVGTGIADAPFDDTSSSMPPGGLPAIPRPPGKP